MTSSVNKISYRNTLLGREKDSPYERMQRGDYEFNVDEHYSLINELGAKYDDRLIGVMGLAKYTDGDKYRSKIDEKLLPLYDPIIVDSSLIKTLIVCNSLDVIKFVMKRKLKEGHLESCIVFAAGMGNIEIMKYLISRKVDVYPHFAGEALETSLKMNQIETACYIISLRMYISKNNFNKSFEMCMSNGRTDLVDLLCAYYPQYLS